mgnify:CR=1 FL=1
MHVQNSVGRLLSMRCLLQGILLAAWMLAAVGCTRRGSAPEPLRFAPGDEVRFVPVTEKLIALTYDDGPAPPYTTDILDILKAEGMEATFFLVGQNVEQHPEVVRRILAEGHEIEIGRAHV